MWYTPGVEVLNTNVPLLNMHLKRFFVSLFITPADKLSPALLDVEASTKRRPSQTQINNPWRDTLLAQLTGQRDILRRWPTGRGQDPWGRGGVVRT